MQNPIARSSRLYKQYKAMAHLIGYMSIDLLNYVYDNEVGMGQEISDTTSS